MSARRRETFAPKPKDGPPAEAGTGAARGARGRRLTRAGRGAPIRAMSITGESFRAFAPALAAPTVVARRAS